MFQRDVLLLMKTQSYYVQQNQGPSLSTAPHVGRQDCILTYWIASHIIDLIASLLPVGGNGEQQKKCNISKSN